MKKYLILLLSLLFIGVSSPTFARGSKGSSRSSHSSSSRSSRHSSEKTVHVREYKKKNGTVVHQYNRRPPKK